LEYNDDPEQWLLQQFLIDPVHFIGHMVRETVASRVGGFKKCQWVCHIEFVVNVLPFPCLKVPHGREIQN